MSKKSKKNKKKNNTNNNANILNNVPPSPSPSTPIPTTSSANTGVNIVNNNLNQNNNSNVNNSNNANLKSPNLNNNNNQNVINVPMTSSKLKQQPRNVVNLQKIKREQEKAIKEYFNHNYVQAIDYFTTGINLCDEKCKDLKSILVTGRAFVYFRQKDYSKAIGDCNTALSLKSSNWSSYLCRSFSGACLNSTNSSPSPSADFKQFADILTKSVGGTHEKLNKLINKAQDSISLCSNIRSKKKQKRESLLLIIDELKHSIFHCDISLFEQVENYDDLPPLIPIGEMINEKSSHFHQSFSSLTYTEDQIQRALEEKEKGNDAFKRDDLHNALIYYSRAIRYNPNDHLFYSNRALVYLKQERYLETITDCTSSIIRSPTIKAYARRASARAALKEFDLACDDYRKALDFEPQNQSCLQDLSKCLTEMEKYFSQKLQNSSSNSQNISDQLRKRLKEIRTENKSIENKLKDSAKEKKNISSSNPTVISRKLQEDTIKRCSKELMNDSSNATAYFERAKAYQTLGNLDYAYRDYREGLRLDPDNKPLQQEFKLFKQLKVCF